MDSRTDDAAAKRAQVAFQGALDIAKRAKERSVEQEKREKREKRKRREAQKQNVEVLKTRSSGVPPKREERGGVIEAEKARMTKLLAQKKEAARKGLPAEAIKLDIAKCQEALRLAKLRQKIANLERLEGLASEQWRQEKIEMLTQKLRAATGQTPEEVAVAFHRAAKEMLEPALYRVVLAAASAPRPD